ncbi:phage major capsid protein [Bradyrhizobium sp. S69]|uniref:phage major capsid protein n=1 Tax=Bradyrhizobium sp. S69 TaxID=1641856 RepID=UPI00131EAF20|nr:phage major capsid protein [Bradyrhizobium sp. S69]
MNNAALALEFKDADDIDPAVAVTEAIAGLEKKFDDRLKTIEAKSADDAKLKTRLDAMEAKLNRPGTVEVKADNDNGGAESKAFASFVRNGREAMDPLEIKSLVVANDTGAGYLAPPQLSTELIKQLTLFSPVRAAAYVGQTGSPSIILPSRTGITNALWEGETEASQESDPAFGQLEIPIFGMKTYTDISVQLLEDTVQNVEAILSEALGEDFGKKEGTAFVNGTGNKQPRGIMVHPGVTYFPNGSTTVLSSDALIDLMYSLPPAYRNSGAWMMNGTTIATVRKLKDTVGQYLWQPSLIVGQPDTLLGRPVIEAIDMPDATAGNMPIVFGNFNIGYRIYDRVSLTFIRDPFTQALNSLVRFHARRRVGGDVVQPQALRKLKMAAS